jgi:hypothetical protein
MACPSEWPAPVAFFAQVYETGHLLRNEDFCRWQKKNPTYPLLYSHPYGGEGCYDRVTLDLLESHSCRGAFRVGPAEMSLSEVESSPFALPRFDCNAFPHGKARDGRLVRSSWN